MTTTTTDLDHLVTAWADAERRGDGPALGALLTDDFVGIGPVGFVLPKEIWVNRFDFGLHYDDLALDEISTHEHGDAAIVVARQHARGEAQGNPTPDDTRVSIVATRSGPGAAWRIALIQYSFMAGSLDEVAGTV